MNVSNLVVGLKCIDCPVSLNSLSQGTMMAAYLFCRDLKHVSNKRPSVFCHSTELLALFRVFNLNVIYMLFNICCLNVVQ